jgi:hypothetical protein
MGPSFKLILSLFAAGLLLFSVHEAESKYQGPSVSSILDSAEGFFIFLKQGEYMAAWELLSEKSQKTIINDIYRSSKNNGMEMKKGDIIRDIDNNGLIFNNYWKGFMLNFDPDVVLNDRVWEFENIESDHAVILLKKRAITKLHMYKEDEHWRVGLIETFWTRKPLKFIKYMNSLFSNR